MSGMMVSDGRSLFYPTRDRYTFEADLLPRTISQISTEGAYGRYILWFDACADQSILLHDRTIDGSYSIDWACRVAQAYIGHEDFEYALRAEDIHIVAVLR